MPSVMYNATGTVNSSFAIGKIGKGVVIYQGTTEPLDSLGNDGDLFILTNTSRILQKTNGTWRDFNSKIIYNINSDTTITATNPEEYYLVDASIDRNITLSSSSLISGYAITIKNSGGSKKIIVSTEGTETIDGANSVEIKTPYAAFTFISDGSNWFIF